MHNEPYSHPSCPLSSSRRFTPYDIQPRLTYKTPPMRPTHKRTPTQVTLTKLNFFIAHLEWVIEPPVIPPPPTLHPTPRVSRAKSTEEIEQSVPSVLDSAASIDDSHAEEQCPLSYRSRSPSPLGSRNKTAAGVLVRNLLLSPHAPPTTIPVIAPHLPTQLPAIRPTIQTQTDTATVTVASTPSLIMPTSAYFSTTSMGISSPSSSPTMITAQERPLASLPEPDDGDVCAGDETEDSANGRDKGKRKAQTKGKEESRCEKICELACGGKEGRGFGEGCEWEGMMMGQKGKSELSPSSSSTRPRRSQKTTIPAVDSIPQVATHTETTPKQDVLQPGSTSIQIQSDDPSPLRILSPSTLPESTTTLPSDAASPGDGEASRMGTPGTPSLRRPPYFMETSAKTAQNVERLFMNLIRVLRQPRIDTGHTKEKKLSKFVVM
ncbi:uncharacterized protein LACBIDRAFT_333104 [Laccaria bicolor S238N-H82]|uniref:Predicted protein n=1 Tax=Laccaria bicolor (strain S238N-H82 / ATCC MYA-4686) TaxID=486041 RepID=B0DUW1_LACBS|nr:uncharacterized protein LACBIDRAFT_333104 [Laccaria bicolor S238N-H82]EDR01681.1 predicted protein [Laccaria bicolor S238N-H82]|eukprot:XP_001887757.1 predicted protein [Laccaria bicolor S238N-H82]